MAIKRSSSAKVKKGNTSERPIESVNGDLYYNTETSILEVFDGGWWVPNEIPGAPTSVVATNQGSGRSYNNGQASVSFTPGTIGGKATSYTVISSPGLYNASGSSSPITITGLQSSTQYTYTVTASGLLGSSAASSASLGVTATTVPQIPGTPTANVLSSGTVSLSFTPGSTGGSAITSYIVTSSPSVLLSVSGSSSPLTVTGSFIDGEPYTFTVASVNENGTSIISSSSNSVIPVQVISVTGGTLTSDSTYYYRTFTGNQTFSVSGGNLVADVLLVAGGGGSGWDAGGGGGGGGVIIANNKTISTASYPVVIGSGGGYSTTSRGSSGNNTTFLGWTANGGGGGGYYNGQQGGLSGGSGGGGASQSGAGGIATQTSGSGYTGYGNNGGSGPSSHYGSGGGGGAGGAGSNGITSSQVSGGLPLYSSNFNNSGSSIAYSGGGYGNSDGGAINDTGYNTSNTYVGYYGFGANGQGNQDTLNSNKNANPGIVVVRYTKSQVGG